MTFRLFIFLSAAFFASPALAEPCLGLGAEYEPLVGKRMVSISTCRPEQRHVMVWRSASRERSFELGAKQKSSVPFRFALQVPENEGGQLLFRRLGPNGVIAEEVVKDLPALKRLGAAPASEPLTMDPRRGRSTLHVGPSVYMLGLKTTDLTANTSGTISSGLNPGGGACLRYAASDELMLEARGDLFGVRVEDAGGRTVEGGSTSLYRIGAGVAWVPEKSFYLGGRLALAEELAYYAASSTVLRVEKVNTIYPSAFFGFKVLNVDAFIANLELEAGTALPFEYRGSKSTAGFFFHVLPRVAYRTGSFEWGAELRYSERRFRIEQLEFRRSEFGGGLTFGIVF